MRRAVSKFSDLKTPANKFKERSLWQALGRTWGRVREGREPSGGGRGDFQKWSYRRQDLHPPEKSRRGFLALPAPPPKVEPVETGKPIPGPRPTQQILTT